MSRFLLDTHVLLWSLYEPARLSDAARTLIENMRNVRLVSAVTAWEIAIKLRLGKLEVARSLFDSYQDQFSEVGLELRQALSAAAGQAKYRIAVDL